MGIAGNAISPILESVAIKSLPSGPQEDTYLKTPAPNLTPLNIIMAPWTNMNVQNL